MLTVLDLFSGIGGFSLGLSKTGGFRTEAFCEIESYPQQVLKKHWPGVPVYDDIQELTSERLVSDGIPAIDVITGGFPCQDISNAGEQVGIEGSRSGLWGEYARLIGEIRPRYAVVENVSALLSGDRGGWFGTVLSDLAGIGYDARWSCISAADCGAPHLRNRVWLLSFPNGSQVGHTEHDGLSAASRGGGAQAPVREESERAHQSLDTQGTGGVRTSGQYVAYPNRDDGGRGGSTEPSERNSRLELGSSGEDVAYPNSKGLEGCEETGDTGSEGTEPYEHSGRCNQGNNRREAIPEVCGMADGLSYWVDTPEPERVTSEAQKRTPRLKALGNAIVPQIVTAIGQEILKRESCQPQ